MTEVQIIKHTDAERDDHLVDCFHDAGFINELLKSPFSSITGRKGSGKTAIARYLEKKYLDYNISYAVRISLRNIPFSNKESRVEKSKLILSYLLITAIQELVKNEIFETEHIQYWKDFLIANGLQQVSDYETFIESQRINKCGFSISASLASFFKSNVNGEVSNTEQRASFSNSPSAIFDALRQSLPKEKLIFIFIDDIGDHLENLNSNAIKEDIGMIKEILLQIDTYNASLSDSEKKLRFVSLLRKDFFDLMIGSNINKLREGSLELTWDEKSFAGLLIRRLPLYKTNLDDSLKTPIESIKKQFPDEIFAKTLPLFNTKRFHTNFYAYLLAISFNRPRDFLKFCYAMRNRLSEKHPATSDNIESAEIEYSDYFKHELRDELFIATQVIDHTLDEEDLDTLIDTLDNKDGFNSTEIKTKIGHYLGEKTSLGKKKIELFIQELYRYGVLGVKVKGDTIIHFSYMSHFPFIMNKIKTYVFCLHRGLWWFVEKRKGGRITQSLARKSTESEQKTIQEI